MEKGTVFANPTYEFPIAAICVLLMPYCSRPTEMGVPAGREPMNKLKRKDTVMWCSLGELVPVAARAGEVSGKFTIAGEPEGQLV